jgi:predicted adenylyl cyclase CyaB
MQTYEVEVKALLGSKQRADEVRAALKALDPDCEMTSSNRQLNHYFQSEAGQSGGTIEKLADVMRAHLSRENQEKLDDLSRRAKSFSVRTRDKDNIVILVVKASVGDDSSENGVARMEFEAQVPLTLNELDELVLSAGFSYQAKWSREREEYVCNGTNVTIDKNAGYGYVAEFERVVEDSKLVDEARAQISSLMETLGIAELPQDRLERMFSYYNAHWQDYYGTDKIFTIE